MNYKLMSIKGNTALVATHEIKMVVRISEVNGKKRIHLPNGIYVSHFRELVELVLTAYENASR